MKNQIGHNLTADQMLLNNAIQIGVSHVVIPGAVRLDTKNWAALAGGNTTGTCPFDSQGAGFNAQSGGLEFD